MSLANSYPDYDPFAWFYNRYWGQKYCEEDLPIFEKLLLPHLAQESHLFELGCGTGHLAQELLIKGNQVTGLDKSAAMLSYARENAPGGKFILGDFRAFDFPPTFHGVLSTSVLNHVMSLEELVDVFQHVYRSMLVDGLFVFDLILEERYKRHWRGYIDEGDVRDEYAWATYVNYNPENRKGQIKVTIFQLVEENWRRSDITWLVKCYSTEEVRSALEKVGFTEVSIYDAERDLAKPGAAGQAFLVCRK